MNFEYLTLTKSHKGLVRRYLEKMSGYSRQPLMRLIPQYRQTGRVRRRQRMVHDLARRYTDKDLSLLPAMDARHDTPSGTASKKLCERACQRFGEAEYESLVTICHRYNLRKSLGSLRQGRSVEKPRPTRSNIGERRNPHPAGQTRLSPHRYGPSRRLDKQKGVCHINAVDEVTQIPVVCTVEQISEAALLAALDELLAAFLFLIRGFHSDHGSEYINGRVAALRAKLFIDFIQSRARQTNDHALVERENWAVVRKLVGHEIMMSPYEKLKSLPQAETHRKPGSTFEILKVTAHRISDNQAADLLQKAIQHLFPTIHDRTQNTGYLTHHRPRVETHLLIGKY